MKCPVCSNAFTPSRKWQRFCSQACRLKAHSTVRDDLEAAYLKIEVLEKELKQLKGEA
jgi:predicted nucleic acid-binding Zn ribbon protein